MAPLTWTDGTLNLGTGGVLDIDDTHRTAGPEGTDIWEFTPSWDTTPVPPGRAGAVRWSLAGVTGPGSLKVYEAAGGGAGTAEPPAGPSDRAAGTADRAAGTADRAAGQEAPLPRLDSSDGLPDVWDLPVGAHGETRWAFDAPGVHVLTFTAETDSGGHLRRVETRLTVRVGDEALTSPAPAPEGRPVATPGPMAPSAPVAPTRATAQGRRAVEAPAAVAAAAGRAVTAEEPVETSRKVLDQGHIDIAARVVGGGLHIHVKDGTVPGRSVWREPSSLVLRVGPRARRTVPANKDFAFLGRAGDPVWLLDQVQQPGLLWPGWSTDAMTAGAVRGDVEFRLAKAEGPGRFALYNYDGLSGATVRFDSGDGVPDAFGIPQNTHAHGGWAFGKEGVYRLTLTMSATLADGTRGSDTETLVFAVGAADPNQVPGEGSTGGSTEGSTGDSSRGATGSATTGASTAGSTGGGTDGGPADGSSSGSASNADAGRTTSGSTGGSSSGNGNGNGGTMAHTGADSTPLLAGAAGALAAVGAAVVLLARRRAS
ncbi:choice-of-anchor M domain-containing protein [Streptomyces sp. NPDC059534]|uniref:choice-of-anchor M domain-containing protein n=1 Tax=Streptomyces sp. NPDC059534 TaxID=3346859 RepID=UPI0036BB8C2F